MRPASPVATSTSVSPVVACEMAAQAAVTPGQCRVDMRADRAGEGSDLGGTAHGSVETSHWISHYKETVDQAG